MLSLLLLLTIAVLLVNYTPVQNFIAGKTTKWLSAKLKTRVVISGVRVDFLNHLSLQGLYVEDQSRDTLLYAGQATIRITDWFMFRDKPVLQYLELKNAYANLYRTRASPIWNYEFIEQAFATNNPKAADTTGGIEFDLQKILLENVRFHMDDHWAGEDLDFDVGTLNLNAKTLDYKKKVADIASISVKDLLVNINEYKGGKPPKKPGPNIIDSTPFNSSGWVFNIDEIALKGCRLNLTMDDNVPIPGLFDENHLQIRNINTLVTGVSLIGDTVKGKVEHLTAIDRCGIEIRDMQSVVSVSPIASICDKLYLETGYSRVRDYYAMYYDRFPDFLEYIDRVVMKGHLDNAQIDTRDIAFFAPEMKSLPALLNASGSGKGTVADLSAKNLTISDGTSVLKGNLTMKGLPDIYTTQIAFTNAELYTNGRNVLRYAPSLTNDPNIDLTQIKHAYFKGSYIGFIESFAVNGNLLTNLGSASVDVKMDIPGFAGNAATYTGKLRTNSLQVGALFRQPMIGGLTCNEDISGVSFNPENTQLSIDGTITEFFVKGYAYHNLITHGTLSKKQFNGSLLVDDPNLALEFDGGVDYREKNLKVNATAHLLYANFWALNLINDTVTGSADFDLDCTGSNIDNFLGYARLYNIDMRRFGHRVAVDSIFLYSKMGKNARKEITINSNDVTASITGYFQLSKLPVSVQYYLSKYIPNFIKAPITYPPDQDLEFSVRTRMVDSLLAITAPFIKGFDSSLVSGSLNTTDQKLSLNITAPKGSIGKFHMTDVSVTGQGNFSSIALGATIHNVMLGDSFLNTSLSLTTTLGHDSLIFTVATTTPDTTSSITLNGQILARQDSLFLSVFPSEFYLNRVKWDIAGGSYVAYSKDFLQIDNVNLTSGVQRVSANTRLLNNDQSVVINTENLDLAQFGSWAGLASYQPEGRLNGTVTIEKIFRQLYVAANMRATGVKLGADTVGNINLIGNYDGSLKLLTFDPQTGIYRDNSSVVASGNISFDSTTNQKLDGKISFNNANVSWASPFLAGIFSHLTGWVNGAIDFTGSSSAPKIDGTLSLLNGGLKVDYMGCYYTVPAATVRVDNDRISFNKIGVYDAFMNYATLNGYFSHHLFNKWNMNIKMASTKFEVMRLASTDNSLFYGNVIASIDSFTVKGAFNNISLHAYNAAPAGKSHIFIPVDFSGDISTYNYVSFKTYGKEQEGKARKISDKMSVNIDANLNDLAEMTIVLDPAAGDAITTHGEGNIQLSMPATTDMSITGVYIINNGTYDFNFKQLLHYHRQFTLNQGSTINFIGKFFETGLNVNATYATKGRLYDILNEQEIGTTAGGSSYMSPADITDAKAPQTVNVLLHMNGTLAKPELSFDLDLPEKRSVASYAYAKFNRINQDARQKFDQVASLLLINSFIPPDGLLGGASVRSGLANNMGQILSTSASSSLTNIVNKILGNRELSVDLKYNAYNYSDLGGGINRNQVKLNVSKNFFKDRLIVQLGSTSDWGRPSTTNTATNFNVTGDFRLQYVVNQSNGMRLNAFRTSDYDVTQGFITRGGVGLSWRKSFDNFSELFGINRTEPKQDERKRQLPEEDTISSKPVGTR